MERMIAYAGQYCGGESCGLSGVDEGVIGWLLATFGVFFFLMIVLVVLVLAFWVWMLADAVKRDEESYKKIGNGEKNLWVVLLIISLFFNITLVMSLIYYFIIYQKGEQLKKSNNK